MRVFTFDLRTFLLASHYGKFNGSKWLDKVAGQGVKWVQSLDRKAQTAHMHADGEWCVIMPVNQIKECWYELFTA